MRRNTTEVGKHPNGDAIVKETILHRLPRVVRNGDRPDFDVANGK